jgi:tRNA nucleotidyltransferase/poly(A) polymerase
LSNAESARLLAIAELEPVLNSETDEKTARAALYRLGTDVYQDRVLIAWSRIGAADKDKAWRALFDLPDRWQPPAFPVTGKDLLAQGYMAGPKLGETLRGLEERWIASDFSLGRDDLLKQL